MKHKIMIVTCLALFFNNCRMPSNPIGGINIINRSGNIDTGGNCLDVDVDMDDGIVVAAANYNGYFIYELASNDGGIVEIDAENIIHVSADDMFESQGDNRAQTVNLSKNHDIAFIMDQYDHVWLYKYGEGASQYVDNFLEESLCFGGTWLSVAIDDQLERIGVYTLLKHNAAESDDPNQGSVYLEYSTSLIWSNLESIDPSSTSFDGDLPDCEYIINQGAIAEKIYFDDGLLSMSYGELGVRVFQQTNVNACLAGSEIIDLQNNSFCIENHGNSVEDQKNCCETTACPDGIGECPWFNEEGLGGIFSSEGGIIPQIHAEFDTPGEVEAIYSTENAIFSGLSHGNGCMMTILDDQGAIINSVHFANGHTIKGMHQDGGLLALAAGHDGILLYDWNVANVSFIGKIDTPHANSVKVSGKIIFIATEDGLEILHIE